MATQKIIVDGIEISIKQVNDHEYISLTDMVRNTSRPNQVILNWLRSRSTLNFLEIWENINNTDFNNIEFDVIKNNSGNNAFTISVGELREKANIIGLTAKAGRYGGTFAHVDIAFNFGYWVSPAFQYYLIREFQKLKTEEAKRLNHEFNEIRFLSKVNYTLQTKAIEENIIPRLNRSNKPFAYSSEADLINQIVFGMTAKQWREANPDSKGNIRDNASILELNILNNLQSRNSELIDNGVEAELRFRVLLQIAQKQFERLADDVRLQSPGEPPNELLE